MKGSLDKRLRVLRAERGYSLTNASERIGIDRHTLRQLELGEREPYYGTLRKIAAGYGVEIEDLVETPAEDVQKTPKDQAPTALLTESDTERRSPDLGRLSSNLKDRIRNFLGRWIEVADYLQRLEGEPTGGYVWLLDLHRNVTREAAFLLRDVVELGDYVGLASNLPQLIHAAAERVRLAVDLAVARAELEEAAQWNLLMREIAYDLAKTKPEEEDEFARVVDLATERGRRRVSDSDDTTATRDAV